MKRNVALAASIVTTLGLASVAVANVATAPATPSARLSIELDVKPVEGQAGRFLVSSTVTDLESDAVIAKPQLMIAADKPARIETGAEGKWKLQISVAADPAGHKAAYDATFIREGQIVSKQRLSVSLGA